MHYRRTMQVAALPEAVWDLLTDLEGWPRWTASMERIDRLEPGPLQVGSRAMVQQPAGRPMEWTVTVLEPGRNFTWQASSGGMTFTGGHELTPTELGVEALLTFELSGPLARLGALLAGRRIRRYVDLESEGLRRAAEGQARRPPT